MINTILIKPGELWLKGRNRKAFIEQLLCNIQHIANIERNALHVTQGRIYLQASRPQEAIKALHCVFGISGFSLASLIPLPDPPSSDMEQAKEVAVNITKTGLSPHAATFKVETRRALKTFEKSSQDINNEFGALLIESFPNLRVDLHNPDFILVIEIRQEGIILYSNTQECKGAKGLPVGVSGKGLVLLSGGIDSPVASWLAMKRGMAIDAVYFHSPPYTSEKAKEKVIDLCRQLAKWKGLPVTLHIPHFTEIQLETAKAVPDSLWTLVHRRFMTKIAERIAKEKHYHALVTGENLGQVASQTIENIAAISSGITLPILRPLIGYDKEETIALAKSIDTYRISSLPYEDCCTVFASKNPKTKSEPDILLLMEQRLSADALITEAIRQGEVLSISA